MNHHLALLTGRLSDSEYRQALEAEHRGLRLEIARPGWSQRWRRVAEAVATFAVLALWIVVLLVGGSLAWAGQR